MRTIIFSFLLLAILSLPACTTHDSLSSTTSQSISSGDWRITQFTEQGNDETADFAGYRFTFSSSGVLSAVRSNISQTGNWSVGSGKFTINLGTKSGNNKPLGELTDDWKIVAVTETEIRLTDDNAANNEFLTFSKN